MQRRSASASSLLFSPALAGVLLAASASALPQSGASYEIAFNRTTGATGLAIMKADGSGVTTLLSVPGFADPSWSPDGQSIAFTHMSGSVTHAAVIDVAFTSKGKPYATNYRSILTASYVSSLAWSPASDEIAVAGSDIGGYGGPSGVVIVPPVANATWGTVHPVIPIDLAWSPDGERLAFTTSSDVCVLEPATGAVSLLWSFGSSTSFISSIDWGRTSDTLAIGLRIENGPTQYEIHTLGLWYGAMPQFVCNGREPTWSPDDTRICFHQGGWVLYVRTMTSGVTKALKQNGNNPDWRRF